MKRKMQQMRIQFEAPTLIYTFNKRLILKDLFHSSKKIPKTKAWAKTNLKPSKVANIKQNLTKANSKQVIQASNVVKNLELNVITGKAICIWWWAPTTKSTSKPFHKLLETFLSPPNPQRIDQGIDILRSLWVKMHITLPSNHNEIKMRLCKLAI